MEQQNNAPLPVELSSHLLTIMTTEHYSLQTGRSMRLAEMNGRASLFVGAVASGLVALAFVGQLAHLATAFFVFSLVVLPTLFVMGLITFERVLQACQADLLYARGINCIRHLYLEYAPHLQPYFILSMHDDLQGTYRFEARRPFWVQVYFSVASMLAMINSVLVGSFVGLLLAAFSFPLWVCASVGGIVFLASVVLHLRYQSGQWRRLERTLPALFPRQPK